MELVEQIKKDNETAVKLHDKLVDVSERFLNNISDSSKALDKRDAHTRDVFADLIKYKLTKVATPVQVPLTPSSIRSGANLATPIQPGNLPRDALFRGPESELDPIDENAIDEKQAWTDTMCFGYSLGHHGPCEAFANWQDKHHNLTKQAQNKCIFIRDKVNRIV